MGKKVKFKSVLGAVLWLIPYFVAGFSAPCIFRTSLTRHGAGVIAGILFLAAGVYAVWLGARHRYRRKVMIYLSTFLLLELTFWIWRFLNPSPLRGSELLGLSGPHWHVLLTTLYLLTALVIFISETKIL
jgi:disulfide bond formation protein DsbB